MQLILRKTEEHGHSQAKQLVGRVISITFAEVAREGVDWDSTYYLYSTIHSQHCFLRFARSRLLKYAPVVERAKYFSSVTRQTMPLPMLDSPCYSALFHLVPADQMLSPLPAKPHFENSSNLDWRRTKWFGRGPERSWEREEKIVSALDHGAVVGCCGQPESH